MLTSNRRDFLRAALTGVAGASLSLAGSQARASTQKPNGRITTSRLAGSLFLLNIGEANVVAMTSADGILMVDGGPSDEAGALRQAVAALPGGQRVHTLFNTHWHPEQTGSNELLGAAGTTIVAHENTRLWLSTDIARPWEHHTFKPLPKQARPTDTFYTTGAKTFGSERVEYGYMLQAHTDGDIYVFFPTSNVLAAGGVVSGAGWPIVDWWTGGWIVGLVNGLDTLLEIGDAQTRIVPAHGRVMTRVDVKAQRDMYATISDRLQKLLRTGRSPDEAVAAEPTKEFNDVMGDPRLFITLAFQSLWPQLSPDA